ncbi:MAG: hypothetical protein ACK4SY_07125 [Pyrobaculum sp.]
MHPGDLAKALAEGAAEVVKPYIERLKERATRAKSSLDLVAAFSEFKGEVGNALDGLVEAFAKTYDLPRFERLILDFGFAFDPNQYIYSYSIYTRDWLAIIKVIVPPHDIDKALVKVNVYDWKGGFGKYPYAVYPLTGERLHGGPLGGLRPPVFEPPSGAAPRRRRRRWTV